MKYNVPIWQLIVFNILAISLLSCNNSSKNINSKNNAVYFTYNRFDGINNLDPAFAKNQGSTWTAHHLFNSLLQLDDDLEIKPSIAKKWNISGDGLTYSFTIRNDVFFHENERVFGPKKTRRINAEDVVYSLSRIIDPEVASPGAWIFSGKVDEKEPFKAVNDTTFQLKLKKPFNPILGILTMQYCSIVPKEALERFGDTFRCNPVGTGPFALQLWEEGEVLLLKRNEKYFEKEGNAQLPFVDGVRIQFIADKALEYLKFKQGELHYISDVDPAFRNDLLTKEGDLQPDKVAIYNLRKAPYLNTEYIGFLITERPELLDADFRRALNYAIDRDRMIAYIRNNSGTAASHGMVPVGMPGFDHENVKGYSYDIDLAKEYLAKAGFPEGEGLSPLKLTTIANYSDWALSIQKQLEAIGVKVRVETVQSSFLREMMRKSEGLELFRASWIADYTDPENYLSLFYGENGAPPNYTRFKNAEFDRLYNLAAAENNPEQRARYYEQMDQIIVNEAPIMPLYYDEVLSFTQKNITGLFSHPMNILDLRRVMIGESN